MDRSRWDFPGGCIWDNEVTCNFCGDPSRS